MSKKQPNQEQEEQWRRADEEMRRKLPPGVKLVRTLRGHTGAIRQITWSPDGWILASQSADMTIRLWNADTGECLHKLQGNTTQLLCAAFDPVSRALAILTLDGKVIFFDSTNGKEVRSLEIRQQNADSIVIDPTGRFLAIASTDGQVKIYDSTSGKLRTSLNSHEYRVTSIIFDPTGRFLAVGYFDRVVKLFEFVSGKLLYSLESHQKSANSITFDPTGHFLAAGCDDRTVRLYDLITGKLHHSLEGHLGPVNSVSFSSDGQLLASRGLFQRQLIIRRTDNWSVVAEIEYGKPSVSEAPTPNLIFHPHRPLLAAVGATPDRVIHIWELDLKFLLDRITEPSVHYVNAKVVLVGDTGVGKSGLSLVLNKQPYKETDSTAGRHVWTFDSREAHVGENVTQTRETLLWDLAGQPGYRVIHQLHLNEVAVALVVFDSRSETDPLSGVGHWERALRLAEQRQGTSGIIMKKFLVSARNDRGSISVSKERLQALLKEFGFDGYFETSAKEGWQISELRTAIVNAIQWEHLPKVSSPQLFADIKSFLLGVKQTGQLLAPESQLYDDFTRQHPDTAAKELNLQAQFDTCIGRLENRDLIRRMTFGGYVLLQPELLDAYASAMVNTAKEEPDGLGSIAEEIALAGKFFVPKEQKVADSGQEQLLLHATVEELVKHDLALRENADDGRYLVFPSQFNRDYEDAPEPKGKAVAITFEGPVQSLYSTLAVRLGHSGLFTTGRAEMWRNAAVFTAKAGGKCGLFVNEFSEGRGRLILFFDEHSSQETRFHFEEYVLAHTKRRSLEGTVELVRFFVCPDCGDPVPDSYVKRLRDKGKLEFNCPCGGTVPLVEPKERIHFQSEVEAMDKSADRRRDFDAFVMSAKGETNTRSFQEWAGGDRVTGRDSGDRVQQET
ncbi:MAG: hypothetical protein HGB19_11190 [Chlorobiales bacterium]|nr:hypothetical protein [Chlorobiales bacterium]